MGDDVPEPGDMLSQNEVRKQLVQLSCGAQCLSARSFEEAKAAYQKVLDLDPRHPVALGFMGMVYHLMDKLDEAIVKYHEVRFWFPL